MSLMLRLVKIFCLIATIHSHSIAFASTSAENRSNLTGQLGFNTGNVLTAVGASFGYFIEADQKLLFNFSQIEAQFLGLEADFSVMNLDWQSFHWNSFYYTAGINFMSIGIRNSSYDLINGETSELLYKTKIQRIGPHLGIGNEWQWENFYLGFEWLGVFYPIGNKTDTEFTENYPEERREQELKDIETVAKTTFPVFLSMRIGWSL